MDMAVANLLKRKIRFTLHSEVTDIYEPTLFGRQRYYSSPSIENVESIGLNDVNDLCTILCKPFVLYAISKIVHEDHVIPINSVTIMVGVNDLKEGENYGLTCYRFENPLDSPELFSTLADVHSCSFPKRLFHKRFNVYVDVKCFYTCSSRREEVRFRKAFNYYKYWQYNLPIEYCSDEESSSEEEFLIEVNR